jgi:hypothetical protein
MNMNQAPADATKEKLLQEFNTVVAETEQLLARASTAPGDSFGLLMNS